MNLLLDEGAPRSAARRLRERWGIEAQHVYDLGLGGAKDQQILEAARRRGAAVVTLDADFHAILARQGVKEPSVIRVRMDGLDGPTLAATLRALLNRCEDDLRAGVAVSITANRVRIRRLPLV